MKSRYYEEECRRLGSVLQCFMAENQALRFSLHSSNLTSNTTSITKQESAVLFLESLLLGSLLWLMAVVCQLLVLPSQLEEVVLENVEDVLLQKHFATSVGIQSQVLFRVAITAGDDVNNHQVEQLENSLKEFRETIQNSLQQITRTLTTLTTHENDERCNLGGPRLSRGRRNDQPQRQRIQPQGEDSDVEDEFENGWNGGRQDFLDWMSELDTFFKFYDIPMGSRVDLVAYKLKGVLNLGGKICNSFVNDKANYLSLVGKEWSGSYVEDDAYNLAIRAKNQLAKSSILIKSVPSVDPSSQHTTRISSIDIGKQVVSTNTTTTKTTNPYARPVMGKCFKCGVPGHRSNDCRANGRKVNLTLRDDEFGNGGETNTSDEDVDAEICHPEGGDYPSREYSAHSFVIQCILLASKGTDSSQ
uniref:BZIP transcription factor 60 n=1 Tax=Tanacetum cinerariifolium TaxID=118510 RepID=A0A6L2KVJ1_TANCI|nr:bZIP transcription factor 60 [Tanacetum cinerariifolium]